MSIVDDIIKQLRKLDIKTKPIDSNDTVDWLLEFQSKFPQLNNPLRDGLVLLELFYNGWQSPRLKTLTEVVAKNYKADDSNEGYTVDKAIFNNISLKVLQDAGIIICDSTDFVAGFNIQFTALADTLFIDNGRAAKSFYELYPVASPEGLLPLPSLQEFTPAYHDLIGRSVDKHRQMMKLVTRAKAAGYKPMLLSLFLSGGWKYYRDALDEKLSSDTFNNYSFHNLLCPNN